MRVRDAVYRYRGHRLSVYVQAARVAPNGVATGRRREWSRDIVTTRLGEDLAVAVTDKARQLREVVDASGDWIVLTSPDSTIVFSSAAVVDLLGYRPDQLVGLRFVDMADPQDLASAKSILEGLRAGRMARVTYRMRHRDGREVWVESIACPPAPGEGVVIATRDVTEHHHSDERLRLAALHDPVTGLANRRHVDEELSAAVARAERLDEGLAVVFLDIDGFKGVNDDHGHAAGDAVLRQVAQRIKSNTRRGDVAGRFGGDEFIIICPFSLGDRSGPALEVERLRRTLSAPYEMEGHPEAVRVSVGAVTWEPGMGAEQLLKRADAAMYAVKAARDR